jgi:hypothetical protein
VPNKLNGEQSDIDDDVELPLPLTTLAQALNSLQVVRKYVRKKSKIPDQILFRSGHNLNLHRRPYHTVKYNQKYVITSKQKNVYFVHYFLYYLLIYFTIEYFFFF